MDKTKQPEKKPSGGMRHGPGGMMGSGEKPKDFKKTLRKLANYVRPHWIGFTVVVVAAIASTVFAIVSPKILGNVTNDIVDDYIRIKAYEQIVSQVPDPSVLPEGTTGEFFINQMPEEVRDEMPSNMLETIREMDVTVKPSYDFDSIRETILLLLGLYLASMAFSFVQGWVMTEITQKITYKLRKEISIKINLLPLSYFDKMAFGDVMSRITNDVDTISQSFNQSLSQIVTAVTTVIGILIMMFSISWQMTMIALLILPLSMGIIIVIVKKSQKHYLAQQETLGSLNGRVEELYAGHSLVKIFNGEKAAVKEFNEENSKLYDSSWKAQFLTGLMFPIMNLVGNIGFVGVSVVGGWLAIKNSVNIGDIQAFIQYLRQFNQPIMQTANMANVMQSTAAAAERVFEFLEEGEELPDSADALSLTKVDGKVSFDKVVFGYDKDVDVINGFTAEIKAGQRVAIVGPTGAGKTTMVNLLMRFYDVKSGSIKIDGKDIRDIKRSDLRNLFAMVLQDTWLFKGTIRENLVYGRSNITEKEMIEAADATHVDHFVRSLPGAYDMVISEEADNISQGEKQLLTIARAMLADSPILILDEATSSVDTRTEVLIQKAMDVLMKGRTSFVIAHRLSTIRSADLILVMREGNIVEQGKHDELMSAGGFYAELYNSQFEEGGVV